ncbi:MULTISPECIES: flagellar basal body rod protein FlgB [Bradyrhizobium]|uniref:Flagellar basal body rod protein FlgB n=1 Tax=Bradyrhizobium betae TaxID=244734 RepID=A0A5P6PGP7_9BRAD|nr:MULTISPECIES: flagellar basal body rod protein FlgB [Bradyrhizobium]MBJ7403105.1 flagellar basal body rod protein FlgB [Bradyrhizobium sp.]QFI77406.1 flagellar basal body rod protein FlgB [Bradyrhizobium betae]
MAINDISTLAALRTKMDWHQQRQRVLAQNVSNSDTPNFKPTDLVEPKIGAKGQATGQTFALALMRTNSSHQLPSGGGSSSETKPGGYQTRPAGNAVSLEEEMQKSAANQMDYAAATALYSRSLGLLKTALGKR